MSGSDSQTSILRVEGEPVLENRGEVQVENGDEGGRVMPRPESVVDHELTDPAVLIAVDEELSFLFMVSPTYRRAHADR